MDMFDEDATIENSKFPDYIDKEKCRDKDDPTQINYAMVMIYQNIEKQRQIEEEQKPKLKRKYTKKTTKHLKTEDMPKYKREWMSKNLERTKTCECGKVIKYYSYCRHKKTKLHQNRLIKLAIKSQTSNIS